MTKEEAQHQLDILCSGCVAGKCRNCANFGKKETLVKTIEGKHYGK